MGVPAFFRWLSRKYPSIIVNCVEEKPKECNGVKIPVDASKPNPNDVEFDNLYLDMNGIIHPCTHPEDKPAPKNEDEMMVAIFEYIDRLFNIVRPRRLLYMAIDGVAPRAKMNQQRSRRFRASKEGTEAAAEKQRVREEILARGGFLPPEEIKERFDSNCITPGTEFMDNLAKCLRYYIADRLNNDPGWKNLTVILSDASVPGEGEHKIMDYIRRQRAQPNHDPNTHHCLCGADVENFQMLGSREAVCVLGPRVWRPSCFLLGSLQALRLCCLCSCARLGLSALVPPVAAMSCFVALRAFRTCPLSCVVLLLTADLIMLGLATHEPNFTIIREEFKPNKPKPCGLCNQLGHEVKDCEGLPREKKGKHDELADSLPCAEGEFIFLRLSVLREYLERELTMASLPFTFDVERSIDDWVFMCFFVGNDFLPHLPSLEIREGAIDRLVNIYKTVVHKTGGYLTESGYVNLQRVQMIMLAVGEVEDSIFKKRKDDEDSFRRRQKEKRKRMKRDQPSFSPGGILTPHALGSRSSLGSQVASNPRQAAYEMRMQNSSSPSVSPNTSFTSDGSPSPRGIKRKAEDSDSEPEPEDNVRLWEAGWKQRYYKNKFDVDAADEKFRRKVVQSYVEGLCWVLRYYYQGCASWKWYYPFHYAPFASDFEGIADMPSDFEKGTKPFKPLEQLMGVFPAASGNFLPPSWRKLMSDPDSSIIDFYPEDFAIDLNGKKYAWQGVALLPFVDERRLRAALEEVYPDLTPEEARRNSLGGDVLFVGRQHPLHDFISELYRAGSTQSVDVPPELCHGIQGRFSLDEEAILPDQVVCSPVPLLRDLTQNTAVSINFKDPQFAEDYVFKAVMLPGARKPAPVLKPSDWEKSSNGRQWKPQLGFSRDRRPVHLDPAAFRTLGHVMPRGSGAGVYNNAAPPPATYQGSLYRPLLRGQAQIPKLMSNMRPPDSWRGPPPLFQQQRFDRGVGAEPLLPWNRMLQTQNAAFQPSQYQMLAGPGGYPPRRDDRGGRQGYPREGRKYPLPPPSGRYSWN